MKDDMDLKTVTPNIVEIVTGITEAQIQSVLSASLSIDVIEPEKLTVMEEDTTQVNYFERVKNLFTPEKRKSAPLIVPIILNNKTSDRLVMPPDNGFTLLHNIPEELINDDNPGSSIINSILKISTKPKSKQTVEKTFEQFHCKCCTSKCVKQKLTKSWCSEPNIQVLIDDSSECEFSDNNNDKQRLISNYQNKIVKHSCQNTDFVTNRTELGSDTTDSYTELDMDNFGSDKNIVNTVNKLSTNVENLKIGSTKLNNEVQQMKNEFQEENDRVSRLIKDAQKLVADLKDLKYLDDLILMLEGQLDEIQMKPWPFKCMNLENNGKNFIV